MTPKAKTTIAILFLGIASTVAAGWLHGLVTGQRVSYIYPGFAVVVCCIVWYKLIKE